MLNKQWVMGSTLSLIGTALSIYANAHVSITSDTAIAGSYYEVTLALPHGCDGDDTFKVEVTVPGMFGAVRATESSFGQATVETVLDGDIVTSYVITWEKSDVLASDYKSYNLGFRTKLPEAPFTQAFFPTIQYCRDDETLEVATSEWVGTSGHHHGGTSDKLPAPSLYIYPSRFAGWNKYTVEEHVHDLSVFSDAEIVWYGTSAFSPNPVTMDMINADPDVTVLEQIHPGYEIWIKY